MRASPWRPPPEPLLQQSHPRTGARIQLHPRTGTSYECLIRTREVGGGGTEYPFRTVEACFEHRVPLKTRRVHRKPFWAPNAYSVP